MNEKMMKAINQAIRSLPGYGVGQALQGAGQTPFIVQAQENKDNQRQSAINAALAEISQLQKAKIKPNPQRYKDIQSQYQGMADEQMQTANDIKSVRDAGLTSAGLSAAAVMSPTVLKKVIDTMQKQHMFMKIGGVTAKGPYGQKAMPWILDKVLAR